MVLFGQPVAAKIYGALREEILKLKKGDILPNLAVILVGEDPASLTYGRIKEKVAQKLGLGYKLFHLPGIVQTKSVEALIAELNRNKYISGIVLQLPLPKDFATEKIIQKIKKEKDMDGFRGGYPPPTAQAILEILKFYGFGLKNKKIVIVGYGRLVGQPLVKLLKKQGLKPIVCDAKTVDLSKKTRRADILISAAGVAGLIKPAMVRKEAVVIDAGTSEAGGKMIGDVAPEVYEKMSAYTPNPGGVGPVTVAMLMRNVVRAAKLETTKSRS